MATAAIAELREVRRMRTATPGITSSAAMAISGRYILRSAPTSVAIGTNDEAGASVMKIQAPRKPTAGLDRNAAMVNSINATIKAACGKTSAKECGASGP